MSARVGGGEERQLRGRRRRTRPWSFSFIDDEDDLLVKTGILEYDGNRLTGSHLLHRHIRCPSAQYNSANFNVESLEDRRNFQGRKDSGSDRGMQHWDGPKWALFAGGAIAAALSLVIGRKRRRVIREDGNVSTSNMGVPSTNTQSQPGLCIPQQNSNGNMGSCSSNPNSASFSSNTGDVSVDSHVRLQPCGNRSKLHVKWDETGIGYSPIAHHLKFFKESRPYLHSCVSPEQLQWAEASSATKPLPLGYSEPKVHSISAQNPTISGRCDIACLWEQNLRRRDEMLLKMQAKLSEQDHLICTQLSRSAALQLQLEATRKCFIEAEQEIQCLRNSMSDYCMDLTSRSELRGHTTASVERWKTSECQSVRNGLNPRNEGKNLGQQVKSHHDSIKFFNSEAEKQAEEFKSLPEALLHNDNLVSCELKGHEEALEKVKILETQLADAKTTVLQKECLIKSHEREKARLLNQNTELQQRMHSQLLMPPVDANGRHDSSAVAVKVSYDTCHSVALSPTSGRAAHDSIAENSQVERKYCFSGVISDSQHVFANRLHEVRSQDFETMTSEYFDNGGSSSQSSKGSCKRSSIEDDLACLTIEEVMKTDSTIALCTPAKEKGLAVYSDVNESSTVRIGSPSISRSKALQSQKACLGSSNIEGIKRRLDRLVLDMYQQNGYNNAEGKENAGLQNSKLEAGSIYKGQLEKLTPPPLSPFSKMIVKLDFDCLSARKSFQDSNYADMNHHMQEKLLSRLVGSDP